VALMTETEFDQYVEALYANPDPRTGLPDIRCAHCGQLLGDYVVWIPWSNLETNESHLAALHMECEAAWRGDTDANMERN
jgi:hypothetical protein